MKKNIAVDSGGTKFAAILYDENLSPIKIARVGSMRPTTVDPQLINYQMDRLLELLELEKGEEIERASGALCGSSVFSKRLAEHCKVLSTDYCGEQTLGWYAAGLFEEGLLSLSGTGSATFVSYKGKSDCIGGYGAQISDEGSGYWMARLACEHAIRDYEGRGPKTLMTQLITEHFGGTNLHTALYKIYSMPNTAPTTALASCSVAVGLAAKENDELALQVIDQTAESLASQAIAAIRRSGVEHDIPITISGSTWRCPHLFRLYKQKMLEYDPNFNITVPQFEPIMGPIIKDYYAKYNRFDSDAIEQLKRDYPQHVFNID